LRHMSRREAIIKCWLTRALKAEARAIERLVPFVPQLYPEGADQVHKFEVVFVDPKDPPLKTKMMAALLDGGRLRERLRVSGLAIIKGRAA